MVCGEMWSNWIHSCLVVQLCTSSCRDLMPTEWEGKARKAFASRGGSNLLGRVRSEIPRHPCPARQAVWPQGLCFQLLLSLFCWKE